ncbi:EamA family transporter [Aeromicrobium senzhongii]|uniref:EamA family transporter n=1 Tax=Aeromicrobium senzhongii TaxID=2663859 RepID=A0ABX6SW26_9ACTN|nr:EamA family transporter [Aeromicrobium senzhongii]MTB89376.1 EamA family transporter [Aeromicrobium senzhongii]QNL94475.1 EamA family transporter [Aeromicrobium senzhongii]
MTRRDSLLAVLVAVIWGCNFVAIHVGLADVPPFLFLAIRFTLVALPLVFFVPRPQAPFGVVFSIGLFMSFGQFGLLYLAMAIGMPAGLAALVLQAQVIFTIVIAAVALGERASVRQGLGAVIGTAGLVVVAWGFHQDAPLVPLLVTVGAALSWAIGNVIARAAKVSSGLSLVVWSALVVPVPCLAVSLVVDGPAEMADAIGRFGLGAWVSTLYTVVLASLVGYTIFNRLMATYPAASVVPFILLVPPVGVLSAWVALDEVPSTLEWVGGVVMMVGVAVATVTLRSRARPLGPSTPAALTSPPG